MLGSLSDKEKADVVTNHNIFTMWKYSTFKPYEKVVNEEFREERDISFDNLEISAKALKEKVGFWNLVELKNE